MISHSKKLVVNGNKVSHTINPLTGFAVNSNLLSVSVISDYAADADALATSFMVMGLKKSIDFQRQEVIM